MDFQLRPMTAEEYDAWVPGAIASYAAEHVAAGSKVAEGALESAKKEFDDLLPAGVDTPEHALLVGTDAGVPVGLLWLHVRPRGTAVEAFVYDVEVYEDKRGKGYGRALMVGGETYAREHGAGAIRLHVFGSNLVARGLYDSLGYVTTNVSMLKPLD